MMLRELIIGTLLYFLLPLWLLAGVADYICHRRTAIERTSGVGESSLHILQAVEVGIPLLLGLFFEINALVLAIMIAGAVAHTLTALWDGLYSHRRRHISPFEQHVHSHLEYVPVIAVLLVVLLYWEQFRALLGASGQPNQFTLTWKREPIPTGYLVAVLGPIVLGQGALLLEEFARTWKFARRSAAQNAVN